MIIDADAIRKRAEEAMEIAATSGSLHRVEDAMQVVCDDVLALLDDREKLMQLMRDVDFYYGGDTHSGVAKLVRAVLTAPAPETNP